MPNQPEHISNGMNRFLASMFKHWEATNAPAWQNETIRQDIGQWFKEHPDLDKAFEE